MLFIGFKQFSAYDGVVSVRLVISLSDFDGKHAYIMIVHWDGDRPVKDGVVL